MTFWKNKEIRKENKLRETGKENLLSSQFKTSSQKMYTPYKSWKKKKCMAGMK